jgi:hypothetical protein
MNLYLRSSAIFFIVTFFIWNGCVFGQADSLLEQEGKKVVDGINELNYPKKNYCPKNSPTFTPVENSREQVWIDAGFKDAKISKLDASHIYPSQSPHAQFTHKVSLTLILLKKSGWSKERVIAQVKRAAEVYRQCGIKFSEIELVESSSPTGKVDVGYGEGEDRDLASKTPHIYSPRIFFIRSNDEGQVAYSWHSLQLRPSDPRYNTAWLADEVDKSYKQLHDSSYNVTAHEIGHILCGCDHISGDEKNLMGGSLEKLNDRLKKEQCDEFKKSKEVTKI